MDREIYYCYKQKKVYIFYFLYLNNTDDFRLKIKTIWILKMISKITTFCGFSYTWWFSGFNILKVILKSNSVSIIKKKSTNIKCSLLNITLHSVQSEIFSIKLWRKLTKFYPMTIISSDHENEIKIFRNHLPCPRILKWFAEINDSTPLLYPSFPDFFHLYVCMIYYFV